MFLFFSFLYTFNAHSQFLTNMEDIPVTPVLLDECLVATQPFTFLPPFFREVLLFRQNFACRY